MKTKSTFFTADHQKNYPTLFFVVSLGVLTLMLVGCPAKTKPVRKTNIVKKVAKKRQKTIKRYQVTTPPMIKFPTRGPRFAPIQIVELHNPLDPQSRTLHKLRSLVWKRYPGATRWQVRMNPRLGKDRGYLAARALLVAHRLGSFWTYLAKLQRESSAPTFDKLRAIASQTGIDPQRFEIGLQIPTFKILIDADMRWSHRMGLLGKTHLFINGRPLAPPFTKRRLLSILDDERTRITEQLKVTSPQQLQHQIMKQAQPIPRGTKPPDAIRGRRYLRIPFGHLEGTPLRGPGDAPVQIIEYSDFTCVPCQKAYSLLHHTLQTYPKKVKFYFKYYPIGIHQESLRVSELAAAAQDRRKFWPLYDLLFRNQKKVLQGQLLELAQKVGLDKNWLAGELDRQSYRRRVLVNRSHGRQIGIRAVPTMIVNGYRIAGVPPQKIFMRIIKRELWKSGAPDPSYP